MSQISDDNIRSYVAFRPSVYTTGVQTVQPYTEAWPEGSDYGNTLASWWYELTGQQVVAGTCVDHQGLLGPAGGRVDCAALSDRMAGRPPGTTPTGRGLPIPDLPELPSLPFMPKDPEPEEEEKPDWKKYALAAAGVFLGVTTLVLIGRKFSETEEEG
jgi:hypothetical protein